MRLFNNLILKEKAIFVYIVVWYITLPSESLFRKKYFLITLIYFFFCSRASYNSYGYRLPAFFPFAGIIWLLWLPLTCLFSVCGHYMALMVTAYLLFFRLWASYGSYGYRFPAFFRLRASYRLKSIFMYKK
jgi:hypothetical protein